MSSASARSPIASTQRGVGAGAALVTGHVKAARAALRVGAQGVEVRGVGLAGHEPASLGERIPEHGCDGRPRGRSRLTTPSMSHVSSPTTRLPAFSASAISDSVP